jgi:hypothetical protein
MASSTEGKCQNKIAKLKDKTPNDMTLKYLIAAKLISNNIAEINSSKN